MLYNIPPILPPKLVYILMEMGHGDEIVLADGNFPAHARPKQVVRCDGSGIVALLDAILPFMPLDYAVEQNAALMLKPDNMADPPIWRQYHDSLTAKARDPYAIRHMERYAFYDRARQAYAAVLTGEKARFANMILRKGVVRFDAE